jgi:hypothetical protein
MDCEPCGDLVEEVALLDTLPTVDTVRIDTVKDKSRGTETPRLICSLWCGSTHSVKCNQSDVPDIEHAVRKLHLKIAGAHVSCSWPKLLGLLTPALRRARQQMRSVR